MSESFEDIRRDQEADKLGSYTLGDARLGVESVTKVVKKGRKLPGKPLTYHRTGAVRDFNDGGRADVYRGGVQATRELTPDEQAQKTKGVALARQALADARARDAAPSPQEIAEKQKADVAELRRKATESWGDSI